MRKYKVIVFGGLVSFTKEFISESRNSKKHISDYGAEECEVYTLRGGELVSAARRWGDGTITNV